MRFLMLAFALCTLAACPKKSEDTGPPLSPTFDERQACGGDADCAAVEIECCDHCNGGTAAGVHKDHAADVRKEYAAACQGAQIACTLMACADAEPICRQGRCGVRIGSAESFPDLPPVSAKP